jgi:hypothetical protein
MTADIWRDVWGAAAAGPDWCDNGKRVRIKLEDGSEFAGELSIDDWFDDGDGGEVPMFYLHADDGRVRHFHSDAKQWQIEVAQDKTK